MYVFFRINHPKSMLFLKVLGRIILKLFFSSTSYRNLQPRMACSISSHCFLNFRQREFDHLLMP